MNEKISVIVPVYKVESYLERCIDSILVQDYTNFELILVNDGSPDRSGQICEDYLKRDPRVRVIHKPNGGLSDARNVGIEASQGEYVTFIDSDDWVTENYLSRLYSALVKNNVDISVTNYVTFNQDDFCLYYHVTDKDVFERVYSIQDWIFQENNIEYNLFIVYNTAWGKLYRKRLFQHVRYPFGRTGEDDYTTYKLYLQSSGIAYINESHYYYTRRNDSITGKSQIFHGKLEHLSQGIDVIETKIALLVSLGYDVVEQKKIYKRRLEEMIDKVLEMG